MADDVSTGFPADGTPDEPTPLADNAGKRLVTLDFVRGIAVLGILAANIVAFGQPLTAYIWPDAFLRDTGDRSGWLWIAQFVLIDGKMRGLFTLLFGAGMMLFMQKAWARGATRWLQLRRLAILLAFGLMHFYLIWKGDILTGYAIIGAIALLFVRMEARNQLILGLIGYFAGVLVYAAMMAPLPFIADSEFGETAAMADTRQELALAIADAETDDRAETALITAGDYTGYVVHNWTEHGADPFVNITLFILETLPLMLIGMALYRLAFFNGGFERHMLLVWGWVGVAIGGVLSLLIGLWVQAGGFTFYGTLAAFIGLTPLPQLFMTVGLAALLVCYSPDVPGWLAQRLIAAGRVAFTNYLGTSIVMVALFHGWGGGLFGRLDRPQLYGVVVGVWVVMLLWSKPWLDRYRYGPLEWLWRCLTYGRIFPFKR